MGFLDTTLNHLLYMNICNHAHRQILQISFYASHNTNCLSMAKRNKHINKSVTVPTKRARAVDAGTPKKQTWWTKQLKSILIFPGRFLNQDLNRSLSHAHLPIALAMESMLNHCL